ncbi:MAG: DUF2577 domain-containing protein [Defluviitaleaceae bacterium]|nr:DUF2577 domain-containing protein [Defluviitaleaceae bacterium]
MPYTAADLVNIMKDCAEETIADKKTSRILFGEVTQINPLRILLEGHEKPMREDFFYLTSNVKIWEEEIRIRSIEGTFSALGDMLDIFIQSDEITATQQAETANKSIQTETLTKSKSDETRNFSTSSPTGDWTLATPVNPAIDNLAATSPYSRTESQQQASRNLSATESSTTINIEELQTQVTQQKAEHHIQIKSNATIKIQVIEKPFRDDTNRDRNRHTDVRTGEEVPSKRNANITWTDTSEDDSAYYDQTLKMKVIRGRGLKVGDKVLCTSHNNQQLFIVHEILNRVP